MAFNPSNISQIPSLDLLRSISKELYTLSPAIFCSQTRQLYVWDSESSVSDNSFSVIKPNDISGNGRLVSFSLPNYFAPTITLESYGAKGGFWDGDSPSIETVPDSTTELADAFSHQFNFILDNFYATTESLVLPQLGTISSTFSRSTWAGLIFRGNTVWENNVCFSSTPVATDFRQSDTSISNISLCLEGVNSPTLVFAEIGTYESLPPISNINFTAKDSTVATWLKIGASIGKAQNINMGYLLGTCKATDYSMIISSVPGGEFEVSTLNYFNPGVFNVGNYDAMGKGLLIEGGGVTKLTNSNIESCPSNTNPGGYASITLRPTYGVAVIENCIILDPLPAGNNTIGLTLDYSSTENPSGIILKNILISRHPGGTKQFDTIFQVIGQTGDVIHSYTSADLGLSNSESITIKYYDGQKLILGNGSLGQMTFEISNSIGVVADLGSFNIIAPPSFNPISTSSYSAIQAEVSITGRNDNINANYNSKYLVDIQTGGSVIQFISTSQGATDQWTITYDSTTGSLKATSKAGTNLNNVTYSIKWTRDDFIQKLET